MMESSAATEPLSPHICCRCGQPISGLHVRITDSEGRATWRHFFCTEVRDGVSERVGRLRQRTGELRAA